MTNPPETPEAVQLAVDAGLATWPQIEAALRSLGLSGAAVAEWRTGTRTVGEILLDRIARGLDRE